MFDAPGVSPLQDVKMVMRIQVRSHEESQAPGLALAEPGQPSPAEKPPVPHSQHSAGNRQVQMQRLVTKNSSTFSVWGEDAQKEHPKSLSSCVYCFLEKLLEEQLFWCVGGVPGSLGRVQDAVDAVQTLGKAFIVSAVLAGDCSALQKEENVSPVAAIHQSLATIQKSEL